MLVLVIGTININCNHFGSESNTTIQANSTRQKMHSSLLIIIFSRNDSAFVVEQLRDYNVMCMIFTVANLHYRSTDKRPGQLSMQVFGIWPTIEIGLLQSEPIIYQVKNGFVSVATTPLHARLLFIFLHSPTYSTRLVSEKP